MKKSELLRYLWEHPLEMGRMVMPEMFTVQSADFHRELEEDYLRMEPLENVIAPRSHAKSSVVGGVFGLHHLFGDLPFRPRTERRFLLLISKTSAHAIRLLDTLRSVVTHSRNFNLLYGNHTEKRAHIWKNNEIVFDTGDIAMAMGMGQHIIGLKKVHQRPTLVILDDPEDPLNTKTVEAMDFNFRWTLQSLLPIVDPKKGRVWVIGTPQNERCLVLSLKLSRHWRTRHYSAELTDGKALWPEWMSWEQLQQKRAMYQSMGRLSSYYREYLCEVVGGEDQLWKEEEIHYWNGTVEVDANGLHYIAATMIDGVILPEVKKIPIFIFLGVDPASSVRQTADYSVIFTIGADENDRRYCLDYKRIRVSPMRLGEMIISEWKKYRPTARMMFLESTGYQEMLRDYLRRSGERIPGTETKIQPRTTKSSRIESLQPWTCSGKLLVKMGMNELVSEMLFYPKARNDDTLDGLYYANQAANRYGKVRRKVQEKPFTDDEIELQSLMTGKVRSWVMS